MATPVPETGIPLVTATRCEPRDFPRLGVRSQSWRAPDGLEITITKGPIGVAWTAARGDNIIDYGRARSDSQALAAGERSILKACHVQLECTAPTL